MSGVWAACRAWCSGSGEEGRNSSADNKRDIMVIKYSDNGLPWEEPPYTWERGRQLEKAGNAAPVSITRAPRAAPQPQPPQAKPRERPDEFGGK